MDKEPIPYFPEEWERPDCGKCGRKDCWSRGKFQRNRRDFTYTSGRCPRLPDNHGRMWPEDALLWAHVRPDKTYIDSRGWKYRVMPGLSGNEFKARYQKPDSQGESGWHGVRSLPWQYTQEEAQADLDAWAEKKHMSVYIPPEA